jgi:hypothetical protein
MDRNGPARLIASATLVGGCVSVLGCTPTVNVVGTYFPPSLVCASIGVVASYLFVRGLARNPAARPLAQSALFFASVAVIMGSAAWWLLFREF